MPSLDSRGVSGLEHNSGFIRDDFLDDMRGLRKYENLNEMRLNSPVVGAALNAIKMPIRNISWFYTSDQGESDPRLDLLNEAKENMSLGWGEHLMEALTFIEFGFAPVSIKYKRVGSKILWDRLYLLGQDTVMKWDIDDSGVIKGLYQWPHLYKPFIPIEKILLFRVNAERNNPEGRSLLRNAFIPYYYVRELTKIEAIGKERGMAGIPIIKLPEGADDNLNDTNSDASKAAKVVRNVRMDEQSGIVLPFGWEFELANTGVNTEMSMNQTIQRHESRLLMSLLSQFIMLGLNSVGTQSKAESDMDLFNVIIDAIADIVAETHTQQAIPRLMELNGMDYDGLRLEHNPPGDINFVELAQALAMMDERITWTTDDEVMARGVLRLPRIDSSELETLREEAREQRIQEELERIMLKGPKQDQSDRQRGGKDVESGVKAQTGSVAGAVAGPTARDASRRRRLFESEELDNPPDDIERLRHESLWFQRAKSYFSDAHQRVLDGLNGR